ncbi:small ubiquitin-related modifier 1-like protein [Tanacetum coccineum]
MDSSQSSYVGGLGLSTPLNLFHRLTSMNIVISFHHKTIVMPPRLLGLISINCKLIYGLDGNEVFFRIERSTQLKKLVSAYCDRKSVEINSIAFLFDVRHLRGEHTPDEIRFLPFSYPQLEVA